MSKLIRILAVTAIVCFCAQVFSDNKADVDLWGNVGFVRALPGSQGWRNTNTFSFTDTDHTWTNHEWLSEYIYWKVYRGFGNQGLLILKIIMGMGLIALLEFGMRKDGLSGPSRFLFILLIVSTVGYGFSTRPHLFTYLMLAFFILFLKLASNRPWWMWLGLPIIGIVWTNLHGAFFTGIVLLLGYSLLTAACADKLRRKKSIRCALLGLASTVLFFLASLVNPYGVQLWDFIFQSAAKVRPYLSEWAPFNPIYDVVDHIDFIVLSIIVWVCIAASSRKKSDLVWLGILAMSYASALAMRRNIPLFAITAALVAPKHIQDAVGDSIATLYKKIPALLTIAALVLFIPSSAVFAITFNKQEPFEIEIPRDRFPVSIIKYMKDHEIKGNLLVFFDWAEYAIWKLFPDCSVFLDGRFRSAYSTRTIDDYFNFLYLQGDWKRAITEYPTELLLLHRDNPVTTNIMEMPEWKLLCQDNIAMLFAKTKQVKQGDRVTKDLCNEPSSNIFP